MILNFSTLKKSLCTLAIGSALLLGAGGAAQAQRHRHGPPSWTPAYGYRNNRPHGQLVSARVHRRNELRREQRLRDRLERGELNDRLRIERENEDNDRGFRRERREDREDLRIRQREDRGDFPDRGNGRGRGRH